jgi:hypothetical protein
MRWFLTFFAVAFEMFGESPQPSITQQAALVNIASSEHKPILAIESAYCMQESWGAKFVDQEGNPLVFPGLSNDLLNPYRQLIAETPKRSLNTVLRGAGLTRTVAIIFTWRLPNLRHSKAPTEKHR